MMLRQLAGLRLVLLRALWFQKHNLAASIKQILRANVPNITVNQCTSLVLT